MNNHAYDTVRNPFAMKIMPFLILTIFSVHTLNAQEAEDRTNMQWYGFDEATELAVEHQKKVMLFMEADWCTVCKRMKREVFPKPEVQELLSQYFYPVRVDIESEEVITYQGETMSELAFSKNMNLYATPTFIFLDDDGSVIGNIPGFIGTKKLISLLQFIHTDAYKDQTFEEFIEQR